MQNSIRYALITGASSGIGKALAECFAKDGVHLVISARNEAALRILATQWSQQYCITVTVLVSDLSQPGAAEALAQEIKARAIKLDYLVNNAGVGHFGLFVDSSLETETSMMRLNMEALVILTKRLLPDILARKGRILNVASTAAFQPGPYMAIYYATKSFVLSFSEALAAEISASGVTVTALCPGPTASGFQDKAVMQASALVKGKRLPTAEAVAEAGYRAMMSGKRVYIPGFMNWIMAQSIRFTPRLWVTSIVKMMSKPV